MKKEYLSLRAKEYNEKSDTELVDLIATEPSAIIQGAAKAILDQRTKRTIQYLTEVIKKNSDVTEKYNKVLTKLTWFILIFTIVMTVATIISIFK